MATHSPELPPSPPTRPSAKPPLHRRTSSAAALTSFSVPFQRFVRDDISDWASGFTLLDTMETYFDSRIDLLQRSLAKHSDRLKMRAEEKVNEVFKKDVFKSNSNFGELQQFRMKMSQRVLALTAAWHSTNVVKTREKVVFFFAVMSVMFTGLMFGMAPEWIHVAYTVQAAFLLPLRVYKYKKRSWHYFLFDLCYYCNILNFVYIWLIPESPAMFVACYCLAHGSLASAVITWRNSLVFHDFDKVTSLFIHIYPPVVFTVIRHFYPEAEARFPALALVPHLNPWQALILSGIIYSIWQLLYWKFVFIDRRNKVRSGLRTTSFSYLLNDKRGVIGRMLAATKPENRETYFMIGQLVYSVLTELPAVFLLYDSRIWSGLFLIFLFAVSVWNGGGYYIEVFGRKLERELEALRKELAEANARSQNSSPILGPQSDDDLSSVINSPDVKPTASSVEVPAETIPLN